MAVNINIPSQVKTYANLAAFPATGSLKTIFIAEDTNKTYRWTGSVYVEISGADFSGFVPTSRTLTINGVTQDLSADRTFTIATGLTVGTTPIASGTIGRVLFQGTGNVLQQSSSLFWDNTGFLGIGTSTPNAPSTYSGITINSATAGSYIWFQNAGTIKYSIGSESNVNYHNLTAGTSFLIRSGGSSYFNVVQSTGNVQIGTTTDAGFRLDVNGTARVQGAVTTTSTIATGGNITVNSGTLITQNSISATGPFSVTGFNVFINNANASNALTSMNGYVHFGDTSQPPASSQVTITSTTRGFLPPRMTTTQKNAIASPAAGLVVYDTTLNKLCVFTTAWETVTSL